MTIDKRLLRERNEMKRSRPKFRRSESWRYKRIKSSWRRPMGIDNKMRHHKRGWPKIVRIGYRGPKAVRGLTSNGKEEVLVHNIPELELVNKDLQIARIGSTVGVKKKINITNKADELGIKIINRPEEALTFATISEISDELMQEDEDLAKVEKKVATPRKKKPSADLSEKELEELEKIENQLSGKTTTKKTTTTPKPSTPSKKPATTSKSGTPVIKKETSSSKTTKQQPAKTATTTKTTKPPATSPKKVTSTKSSISKSTTKTPSSKVTAAKKEKEPAATKKEK